MVETARTSAKFTEKTQFAYCLRDIDQDDKKSIESIQCLHDTLSIRVQATNILWTFEIASLKIGIGTTFQRRIRLKEMKSLRYIFEKGT